ncbi:hypothetical protein HU200_056536 [Digitaria exilis]|uniref:Uncharacterized protein n=1 Tax=Digitaria exilis TaxID=1010633 RepID=A0A835AJB5_9POAL|nr:hypothetical protein HU200_056536 [Digitaria exilis]
MAAGSGRTCLLCSSQQSVGDVDDVVVVAVQQLSEVGSVPVFLLPQAVVDVVAAACPRPWTASSFPARCGGSSRQHPRQVKLPAAAILRERKSSNPSPVAKVAAASLAGAGADADYYREALEGVETHLLRLAEPPQVTHLALRVSWPPGSALRGFPQQFGFVSSADRNLLVLCVGNAPVCFNASRGFYLVHDAMANSVAVVPRLPPRSVPTMFSHRGIGTGVAVLRRGDEMTGEPFLLAELFLRRDRGRRGRTSNKATLFIWFGSGPASGGWTEKEVTLPFPSGYRSSEVSEYSFTADTVLAVGGKSLCWVDRRWNGWRREWGMDGDGKKMGAGGR